SRRTHINDFIEAHKKTGEQQLPGIYITTTLEKGGDYEVAKIRQILFAQKARKPKEAEIPCTCNA
ncbi:MAG: hypothetical protein ABR572_06960, partial [Cryomorphaceae bacterium]